MPPTPKRWNVEPEMPPVFRTQFPHVHPLLLQMLYSRRVTEPAAIDAFLQGTSRFDDPFDLTGVAAATERIRGAITTRERIVVYGDYDADGVTATVLLVEALRKLGATVGPYIPHRVDEGYGLNSAAMDKIADSGARLVVTVDCGVRSPLEVEHARSRGLDVIITDHHSIAHGPGGQQELPAALAVINPKQDGDAYGFKDLAGVGLAYKLVQALLAAERVSPLLSSDPPLVEKDLLDLVALGTVADVAPLLGENRVLVQRGLAELRRARRPGVQAILEEAKLAPAHITSTSIGFVLGPRLNAAGRLDSAALSYKLLTAPDLLTAGALAMQLGRLNRQRQDMTQELVGLAHQQIDQIGAGRQIYLIAGPQFNPGVVGLVAGRLTEELYRPTLVAEVGEETTHGSARSIPEFDITGALDQCRDLLVRHGGHAMAAGFTVLNSRWAELRSRLEALATGELAHLELQPTLLIDAEVSLSQLDWAVLDILLQLEPCGHANPQPVLATYGLEIVASGRVGKDSQHLKLTVRDPRGCGPAAGQEWEAIAFRQGGWFSSLPRRIDLAYTLERNEYNGAAKLQLNVKDIRAAAA